MSERRSRLSGATPILVLLLLSVAIAAVEPRFLSLDNLARLLATASAPLVLALGATFIILMGSIDLSIEGSMAFTASVLAALVADSSGMGFNLGIAAVPVALLAAAAFGLVTGLVHVHLKVPTFMASLGMGFVGLGIATVLLGGERVGIPNQTIRALALSRFLGLPPSVYVGAAMVAVAWYIQNHTRIGRYVVALGGGEDLAEASGIDVGRVRILAFAIAGAFFGVGAILVCARLGAASALIGSGQLFTVISAIVVGGTSLAGGKGGVFQTVIGVLIVVVLNNGMIILGLPSFVQQGVLGLAIVLAVLFNSPRGGFAIVK